MTWKHIDLFSGIGGFAYAFREVFGEDGETALFCDNDKYCQEVLRRHWPEVPIWSDIRELIAHAPSDRRSGEGKGTKAEEGLRQRPEHDRKLSGGLEGLGGERVILTGGFPCQPFSHAGKRRGKGDDRFLWPEMLECIRIFKPSWVIAENVYGILSIEKGMVFEQVCSDMEKEGYEVWPFIIPACAVNAPHRRDRVWFVAHSTGIGRRSRGNNTLGEDEIYRKGIPIQDNEIGEGWGRGSSPDGRSDAPIPAGEGLEREINQEGQGSRFDREAWQRDWKEVALATCVRGVDDGIPNGMDGISKAKHRTERLKMLGNAIVPQVAMEIMKAIKETEEVL